MKYPKTQRTRRRQRSAVLALTLGVALLAPWAAAREATVTTRDGREITGELKFQDDQTVILLIAGIETAIPRKQIADLVVQPTPEEVYQEERPKLERDDLDGRFNLARRMFDLDALEIARVELGDLARDFPREPRVTQLINVIDAKLALQKEQADAPPRPRDGVGQPRPPREREARPTAENLLTAEQINLIRVYQIDLGSEPRGVRVDRSALPDFFDQYREKLPEQYRGNAGQREFRRLAGYEQLGVFFDLQARDFYDKVKVTQDPPALQMFRVQINPTYVARYFRDHFGKGQVEGLALLGTRPDTTDEAYTNFFLLNQFRTGDGLPLIDHARPEESLLVQWGLPRDQAKFPAPDVPGWQPMFRSLDDQLAQRIINWINSLYEVQDYGITFPAAAPEAPAPPTAPAEAP